MYFKVLYTIDQYSTVLLTTNCTILYTSSFVLKFEESEFVVCSSIILPSILLLITASFLPYERNNFLKVKGNLNSLILSDFSLLCSSSYTHKIWALIFSESSPFPPLLTVSV
jgi:hypothetical protein